MMPRQALSQRQRSHLTSRQGLATVEDHESFLTSAERGAILSVAPSSIARRLCGVEIAAAVLDAVTG
jgi:hypothetical protein